jgi:hypothetical protein
MENIGKFENIQFFDYKSLFVFQYFTTKEPQLEELIIYDFLKKFDLNEDIFLEIWGKIDLYFLVTYLLRFFENQKIDSKDNLSRFIKKFEKYKQSKNSPLPKTHKDDIKELYEKLTDSTINSKLLNKKPYCLLIRDANNKIEFNEESFLPTIHILSNYTYYLLTKYLISNNQKNLNSFHPKAMNKAISNLIQLHKLNPELIKNTCSLKLTLILVNSFLRFYNSLPNKVKLMLYDNESFMEIYLNLISYNYSLNFSSGQYNNNFLFLNKLNVKFLKCISTKKVIQTSIMLINTNKSNLNLSRNLSSILSCLMLSKSENIFILMDIFNSSELKIEQCSILVKKLLTAIPMITSDKKHLYYEKIINFILSFLLCKKNIQNDEIVEGLKALFLDTFIEIINKFCDNHTFISILFTKLFKNIFKKIGLDISCNNEYMIQIIESKYISTKLSISNRQLNYIKFLIDNFGLILKSKFHYVFENFNSESLIKTLFSVYSKLWNKNKFYYENFSKGDKRCQNLQVFVSLLIENVDYVYLPQEITKYFTKSIFKNIFKNIQHNFSEIEFEFMDNSQNIIINRSSYNYIEYLQYITSNEYTLKIQNSIENIFQIFPFNNPYVLSEILHMFIDEKISLKYEMIYEESEFLEQLESNKNLLYNTEEKESVCKLLIKVNNLYNIIKYKILLSVFNSVLSSDKMEEYLSIDDFIKLIIFLLKEDESQNNPTLKEGELMFHLKEENYDIKKQCLNCLEILLKKIKEENLGIRNQYEINNIIKIYTEYKEVESINKLLTEISKNSKKESNSTKLKQIQKNPLNSLDFTNKIIDLNKKSSNLDRAYILNEINKILIKTIYNLKKDKSSSNIDLNSIKQLFDLTLNYFKICDIHLNKICEKILVNLFELCLYEKSPESGNKHISAFNK